MRVEISIIIHGKDRTHHDADIHFSRDMSKRELIRELEDELEAMVSEHFSRVETKE